MFVIHSIGVFTHQIIEAKIAVIWLESVPAKVARKIVHFMLKVWNVYYYETKFASQKFYVILHYIWKLKK
jgi:hypothetical protein